MRRGRFVQTSCAIGGKLFWAAPAKRKIGVKGLRKMGDGSMLKITGYADRVSARAGETI